LDMPTIGVAKSMLTGGMKKEVTHADPVSKIYSEDENDLIGYAYLSSDRAKNPIYISPGHKVSPRSSLEKVKTYCEYKIPQPVRKAHIRANKTRRDDE
ncbi:MAG: endonuclease V, partial [Thermoplasmatota archaeon]